MRAIRLYGTLDARLEQIDRVEVGPGEIELKIAWAGICGSDLSIYANELAPPRQSDSLANQEGGRGMGHEFSGYVSRLGQGVTGFSVGDLVTGQPNFADGPAPPVATAGPICATTTPSSEFMVEAAGEPAGDPPDAGRSGCGCRPGPVSPEGMQVDPHGLDAPAYPIAATSLLSVPALV